MESDTIVCFSEDDRKRLTAGSILHESSIADVFANCSTAISCARTSGNMFSGICVTSDRMTIAENERFIAAQALCFVSNYPIRGLGPSIEYIVEQQRHLLVPSDPPIPTMEVELNGVTTIRPVADVCAETVRRRNAEVVNDMKVVFGIDAYEKRQQHIIRTSQGLAANAIHESKHYQKMRDDRKLDASHPENSQLLTVSSPSVYADRNYISAMFSPAGRATSLYGACVDVNGIPFENKLTAISCWETGTLVRADEVQVDPYTWMPECMLPSWADACKKGLVPYSRSSLRNSGVRRVTVDALMKCLPPPALSALVVKLIVLWAVFTRPQYATEHGALTDDARRLVQIPIGDRMVETTAIQARCYANIDTLVSRGLHYVSGHNFKVTSMQEVPYQVFTTLLSVFYSDYIQVKRNGVNMMISSAPAPSSVIRAVVHPSVVAPSMCLVRNNAVLWMFAHVDVQAARLYQSVFGVNHRNHLTEVGVIPYPGNRDQDCVYYGAVTLDEAKALAGRKKHPVVFSLHPVLYLVFPDEKLTTISKSVVRSSIENLGGYAQRMLVSDSLDLTRNGYATVKHQLVRDPTEHEHLAKIVKVEVAVVAQTTSAPTSMPAIRGKGKPFQKGVKVDRADVPHSRPKGARYGGDARPLNPAEIRQVVQSGDPVRDAKRDVVGSDRKRHVGKWPRGVAVPGKGAV